MLPALAHAQRHAADATIELEPEAAGAVIRLRKSEPFTVRPAHGNVLSLPHLLESEVRNAAITLDLGHRRDTWTSG